MSRFQRSLIMAHKLLLQPASRFRGARYLSVVRFEAKGDASRGCTVACDLARSPRDRCCSCDEVAHPRATNRRPTHVVAQGLQTKLASRDAGNQGRWALAERWGADGRPGPPAGSFRCGEDAESRGTAAGLRRRGSGGTAWSLYGDGAETVRARAAYSRET